MRIDVLTTMQYNVRPLGRKLTLGVCAMHKKQRSMKPLLAHFEADFEIISFDEASILGERGEVLTTSFDLQ